jgi:hypothetical protein
MQVTTASLLGLLIDSSWGEVGYIPLWRDREVAFCERGGVLRVGGFNVCYVRHCDGDTVSIRMAGNGVVVLYMY